MKRAAALALTALSAAAPWVACGGERPAAAARVRDAADAEARYRTFHEARIGPRLAAVERRRADGILRTKPWAERSSCRDAAKAIASGGPTQALHGSVAALDRPGECWSIRWDNRVGLGLGAVVAADGAVLLAWWIPEG